MRIEDALTIGDLSKGIVTAGGEGIFRKIHSIEVMEVPEVGSWISTGILIMTSFYSIREEPEKQINLLKTLIEKEAAGLVVKTGRFIKKLPEEMMTLANEHSFPIIEIPKDISYINVLMPLYERLYEERFLEIVKTDNPFEGFKMSDFVSISDAIEYLSELTDSPLYIEDIEGRLLYSSRKFYPDKWRESNLLFSTPDNRSYETTIEKWKEEFQTNNFLYLTMAGHMNRLIIPFIFEKTVFAVVHLLYKDIEKFQSVSPENIKEVGRKLREVILNEQLQHQKSRIEDIDFLTSLGDETKNNKFEKEAIVIQVKSNLGNSNLNSSLSILDFSCLYRAKLSFFINQFKSERTIIFEKNHNYYALFLQPKDDYHAFLESWKTLIEIHNQRFPNDNFKVSVSRPFRQMGTIDENVHSVTKTMDLGLKLQHEEFVYTRDKLGVYEILADLTARTSVLEYVDEVLKDLPYTNKELFESLRVYLDTNGNVSKASQLLFIHRRTMTYRIQKIQELLTMNLDNAEHRFILHFCIKLKETK